MNEKIRQLLVEAREQTKEGRHHAPLNVWTEKFAELIAREYGNIVLHYTDIDEGVKVANKHFGVEE